VVGISARVVDRFAADLSPALAAAVPAAVEAVIEALTRTPAGVA
jgi:hypothetical protein